MSAEPLFTIERLELCYGPPRRRLPQDGRPVLAIPRLAIFKGERLALLGPNGAGKTSILKLLNGLIEPSGGSVLFLGERATCSAALRRRSVYVHQHPWLFSGTVSHNLRIVLEARVGRAAAHGHAEEQLIRLGLEGYGERRTGGLSGGEAQRVALARALCSGADILLLDEPTANADAGARALIAHALASEAERGATLVVATHDRDLIKALGARVLHVEGGTVAERKE